MRCLITTLLLTIALASTATAAERQPNVVFFLVDDLGWKDVGCYGSEFYETPSIDGFAKQAVRFTNAYAACHVCSPTRASIMTGKYPARIGLTDWISGRRDFAFQSHERIVTLQELPDEETTIAELLKQRGYRTGHFGKWHLGEEPHGPRSQGFDVQVPQWNKGWPRSGYYHPFNLDGIESKDGDYLTDRLTDEALKFIDKNHSEPFFLYLSHFAVHDPIHGRPDLVKKYNEKNARIRRGSTPEFILEGNPDDKVPLTKEQLAEKITDSEFAGYQVLPQRTVKIKQRQDNAEFAGMVESMDESFGRVLTKLRELGLEDDTIVIFFSDNGGMSGANFGNPEKVVSPEHLDRAYSTSNLPLRGAKGWLYEGGIREPMLVRWPGRSKEGITCDTPVISVDFLPSIMEMVDPEATLPADVDGKSFAPLLTGNTTKDERPIYWHFPHYSNHGMQSPGGAIRVGEFKLLEYFENNTVQLFNLKEDIGEQNDLANTMPEKARELQKQLADWRETVGAKIPAAK